MKIKKMKHHQKENKHIRTRDSGLEEAGGNTEAAASNFQPKP